MGNSSRCSAYLIALLAAGHFFSDFYVTFLPGLLPVVMERLGLSLTLSGLLVMVYSFASNIIQPVVGYFIDKSGLSWLILVTIPVSALFICLSPIAGNVAILFLFFALSGLAAAVFHPLASALLAKAAMGENRGLAMSFFIGGGNVGVAAAPLAVILFLTRYPAEQLVWLAVPGILLTVGCYFAGVHRIQLVSSGKKKSIPAGGIPWYRSVNLLKLNVVMGLRSWPQNAVPNFLAVWLIQQGQSTALAGIMLTVFFFGGAVGSVFGGYLGDKVGRKNCIIGSLAVCIPALYFFLISKDASIFTWATLFLSGASLQSTLPSSIVWAQDMLPSNAAMASGMMLGLSYGLGGVGAAITGAAADVIGLETALLWSIVPLVVAIGIAAAIPEKKCLPAETSL